MSAAFALYRLPHADHYYRIEGAVDTYSSCSSLNGVEGFVVAPFAVTEDQPIVVIRPDKIEKRTTPDSMPPPYASESLMETGVSPDYSIDFRNFHSQLSQHVFQKIVLARSAEEMLPDGATPESLFLKACILYPRLFVAQVFTAPSGCWLTATPEILLEGSHQEWRTIALAGTMQLTLDQLSGEGESATWSAKNIEEQRLVASYIAACLERCADDFQEYGPRTVRAADLIHLRSDFVFSMSPQNIGDLLQQLHPTPAVCGLPKKEAFQFIQHNEHTPRRYYSGFMGMLCPRSETHLYVSLRCMNILGDRCLLYAGGGLLGSSSLRQEWMETEAKLQTMRRCIAAKKISIS